MNKRIQQLAEQALKESGQQFWWSEVVFEKFAELLIRECAQFVEDKFDFCGDEIIIAEEVRKHFGVEEN